MFYALYVFKWSYFVSNLNKQIVKAVLCKPKHEKQHRSWRKNKEWAEREAGISSGGNTLFLHAHAFIIP